MAEYVERKSLLEDIGETVLFSVREGAELPTAQMRGARKVIDRIKSAPTADVVEVRHGEWVHCDGKSNLWYCSECGDKILYNPTRRTYNIRKRPVNEVNKYCRCCGAKMDGKGDTK